MILFFAQTDFSVSIAGELYQFASPPTSTTKLESIPRDRIYCTPIQFFRSLQMHLEHHNAPDVVRILQTESVKELPGFPVKLGTTYAPDTRDKYTAPQDAANSPGDIFVPKKANLRKQLRGIRSHTIKIALFSGLGAGIGDTLIGLAALREVKNLLREHFDAAQLDVIHAADLASKLQPIFEQDKNIHAIRLSPITLDQFTQYDAYFDIGEYVARPDFNLLPCQDWYLNAMGINYRKVLPACKRNRIVPNGSGMEAADRLIDAARNDSQGILLFHPAASARLRSIPDAHIPRILDELTRDSGYRVASIVPLQETHGKVLDLSAHSKGFRGYSYIVSRMDAIITVDTATYHIADAFSIPTVVWSVVNDPDLWMKYYPFVRGQVLEGARESGFFGRHMEQKDENLESVLRLWSRVDIQKTLADLEQLRGMAKSRRAR